LLVPERLIEANGVKTLLLWNQKNA